MDKIWLRFPDGTTRSFDTQEEAMAAAEEARRTPPGLLPKSPNEGQTAEGTPLGFGEILKQAAQHLPELLPLAASFLGPGGLAGIPLKMALTGAAGTVGNLAAGKGLKDAAGEGALSSVEYAAAPEALGAGLRALKLPEKIVGLGLRGKAPSGEIPAVADAIVSRNIGSSGKATKLSDAAQASTDALTSRLASLRQRGAAGQMTKTPKVAVDTDALRREAVKAVEQSRQVTPRVPLEHGAKVKTEEIVGNLTSDAGPTRIDDAVRDYRALGHLSGKSITGPIRDAFMGKIRGQSDDVAKKLSDEAVLAAVAKVMGKKPPISIFEAGPAVLGTLGGAMSGDLGTGAGFGIGAATLMHALRSPSAWANAGLATKGAISSLPALAKSATFAIKDRDPLADLLSKLKR